MIKAIDALQKSIEGHDNTAPAYWKGISKQLEEAIIRETKRGRTFIKARIRTSFLEYCTEQLKHLGYKVTVNTQDIEITQVLISWGSEDVLA
jgi:hypothetical protein